MAAGQMIQQNCILNIASWPLNSQRDLYLWSDIVCLFSPWVLFPVSQNPFLPVQSSFPDAQFMAPTTYTPLLPL